MVDRPPIRSPASARRRLRAIAPQLAELRDAPPEGAAWLHEIKFDGYRIEALLESGECRLITRNGLDWTARYSAIAAALEKLNAASAILDGEIVALDEKGVSRFGLLQEGAARNALVCFWFDLLHLNGEDLRDRPLKERKLRLEALLKGADPRLRYSTHLVGSAPAVVRAACAMGLEGIVSKKTDAPYTSGRSSAWIKVKCVKNDEFVIGGWTRSTTRGRPFASLLLGEYEDGKLKYRGKVGSGFGERRLRDLQQRLAALARARSPFEPPPPREAANWVEPILVAQIAYAERTGGGMLRHPVFLGLREDKPAEEVEAPRTGGATRRRRAKS
jgi:bifunctional non-homologous end joining protein LigD